MHPKKEKSRWSLVWKYASVALIYISKGFRSIGLYFDGMQFYTTPLAGLFTIVGIILIILASSSEYQFVKERKQVSKSERIELRSIYDDHITLSEFFGKTKLKIKVT